MNEQLVEKVARALCIANGLDPDEIVTMNVPPKDNTLVLITIQKPRWFVYEEIASHHVVAFAVIASECLS